MNAILVKVVIAVGLICLILFIGYIINENKNKSVYNDEQHEQHPYLIGGIAYGGGNATALGMNSKAESNSTAVVMGRVVKRGEVVAIKIVDGSIVATVVPYNDTDSMQNKSTG